MMARINHSESLSARRPQTRQYVVGLGLIAGLSLAAFVTQLTMIDTQQSASSVINASGRRRYTSQRVAMFSSMLVNAATTDQRESARAYLISSIELLEKNHKGLVFGNPEMNLPRGYSKETERFYFAKPVELHMRILKYLEAAKALADLPDDQLKPDRNEYLYIMENGLTNLMHDLDAIVNIQQHENEAAIRRLQMLELMIFLLTILLLSLEAFFIFRPSAGRIEKTMLDLEASADKLRFQSRLDLIQKIDQYLAVTAADKLDISEILALVCQHLGWKYATFWEIDTEHSCLVYCKSWTTELLAAKEFDAVSRLSTFSKGVGLPGRVWLDGTAHWISDVTKDTNFPRAPHAFRAGLRGAFGFPIRFENQVHGVLEFFSDQIEAPDEVFLAHCNGIGVRLGQLVHRSMLEKEIASRQASLVNSSKMAALGEMVGGMAHEINTPLGVIKLRSNQLTRLLGQPQWDAEVAKKITVAIESAADHITKIIQGLRSFSRNAEDDPMSIECLGSIITNAINLCAQKISDHEITLKVNEIPDTYLLCRPSQISQVLINMLSNASDAVANLQDKWIDVSFTENSEFLDIRITDSGSGIPLDVEKNLFRPFFTTKAVGKGTGLGLSISKDIVKKHRGKLVIDRTVPNTCFVITLPKANFPAAIQETKVA